MTAAVRVLLVDDHPIIRQGLAQLFSLDPNFAPPQQAGTSNEARALLSGSNPPDVMVLDLALGKESGLDLLRDLRNDGLTLPVVVLSMYDENAYAERALQAGAQAYLMKQSAAEFVVEAVNRVLHGEIVLSPSMQTLMLSRMVGRKRENEQAEPLSEKEIQVLQLISNGLSTSDIAERLSRSVKTIESHRSSIKVKLGLRSGLELVRYAARLRPDLPPPEPIE
jgi:two-component system, NarL family, response regulator FusR